MKSVEFDQSATFIMSIIEALLFLAAEVNADLVECPLKVEVSVPEFFKIPFIHLYKVDDVTGLCGKSIDRIYLPPPITARVPEKQKQR